MKRLSRWLKITLALAVLGFGLALAYSNRQTATISFLTFGATEMPLAMALTLSFLVGCIAMFAWLAMAYAQKTIKVIRLEKRVLALEAELEARLPRTSDAPEKM